MLATLIAIVFLFSTAAYAVLPAMAFTGGPAIYNPASLTPAHAPVSGIGLAGLAHMPFSNGKVSPFVTTGATDLTAQTPAGSIRFVNDSSYVLQSETSVAVDPSNGNHVVGTFNDGRYFFCPALPVSDCPSGWTASLSGFTTSGDGGRTVDKSSFIPSVKANEFDPVTHTMNQSVLVSWGDPSVVAAPNGLFYYSSLAIDPFTGANGVMLAISNSSLWGTSACITPNDRPTANPCWTAALIFGNLTMGANTLEDKDLGAVDWSVGSAFYGEIYVTWDHFYASGLSSTFGARCTASLSCTMISDSGVGPISGTDPFVAFSMPQVGRDGAVYVSWCNYGTFSTFGPVTCRVSSSPAGGSSFGAPNDILSFMGSGTTYPTYTVDIGWATEQFRTASVPVIASDGSNANNLYFTIAVCSSGHYYVLPSPAADNPGNCGASSILFAKSTDRGATWSSQVISSPAVNDQPWITVDSSTGEVVVTYLTTQFDPFDHRIDVLAKVSTDGGATWSSKRITSVSDDPNADPAMFDYLSPNGFGGSFVVPQFGDYFQVQALNGNLYVLYTGNYVPEQGTYKASPFLATTSSAVPRLELAPSRQASSPGGQLSGASPGDTVPFNATGFNPGATYTVSLNWGGITVPLANGTVDSSGAAKGSFIVPNLESQVYAVTAADSGGSTASVSFGVGQVNLAPLQASISQLSASLSSDFGSLRNSITALAATVSSLQASVVSVNASVERMSSSLAGVSSSMSSGFASLNGAISDLGTQLTSGKNSVGDISSTITATEYLVIVAIVVAAVAAVFAVLATRKRSQ